MDNKKKFTVVLAVFAVVCIFAVLVFSGVIKLGTVSEEETTDPAESYSYDSEAYKTDVKLTAETESPYMKTDFDDIFYTMTKDGAVKFYKYTGTAFTEIEATGTYTASVEMSGTTLSADITYYKDGGKISGYGLYTGKQGEYNLFPYAFFRLAGYGEKYANRSSKSCLLLIDTTADDFYNNNKIYEEPYIFNYSDSSCSRLLSEASRTIGIDGTKRADYSMITDAVIKGSWDRQLFFSGRHYAEDDTKVDLMRNGGSGNNVDNIVVASDVLGYWATYVEGGIMYISVDEKGNVAVMKYDLSSEEAQAVKTFEGVTRDDILVDNGCIYIISKNTVYSIESNTESKLDFPQADNFKADIFVCSGDNFIVRGYVYEKYPTGISAVVSTGKVNKAYTNDLFRNVVNPVVLSDGRTMITYVSGEKYTYYIM